MKQNEKGFSVVEIILVLLVVGLIGVVGFMVYKNHSKKPATNFVTTTTTKPATETKPTTQAPDPYTGWKKYENASLALKFKYPADWKIVDESDNVVGALIRVQSPDYLRDESIGFSGTQISVSPNTSHNTYSADKQRAATSTYGYHNDVKDLTVGGKPAFSYSKTLNETGYTAFYTEVDLGAKGAREFLYQSETKGTPQKYDETNLTVFNKLLESVTIE